MSDFNADDIKYQFKIIMLGDGGSGKTCLTNRYCFNIFEDTKLTIGLSFNSYTVLAEEENGTQFKIGLSIWDFGGQIRFRPLLPQFINGASGALFVYDGLAVHSLLNLEKEWYPLVRDNTRDIPSLLVGTKNDLIENKNPIDPEVIEQCRKDLNSKKAYTTSSKTGLNVRNIFNDLIVEILRESPLNITKIRFLDAKE
ncbi:MAG: Rab family GTPase [Promethearchaeota archaeon]